MFFRVGLIGALAFALCFLPACDQKSEAETSGGRSGRAVKRGTKDGGSATDAKANMSKAEADAKKIETKAAGQTKKNSGKTVIELTNANVAQKVYQQKGVVVVDFYTDWCKPCKFLAPIMEKLAKEYDGKVVFGKIECDRNKETARRHGVRGYPTIIFFKNGEPKEAMMGVQSEAKIKAMIEKLRR